LSLDSLLIAAYNVVLLSSLSLTHLVTKDCSITIKHINVQTSLTQLAGQICNLDDPCCYQVIHHKAVRGVLSLYNPKLVFTIRSTGIKQRQAVLIS
jgi:hypothetical protein